MSDRTPLTRRELDAIIMVLALCDASEQPVATLKQRLQTIPGRYASARSGIALLTRAITDALDTAPIKQLQSMRAQLDHAKITIGRTPATGRQDRHVIASEDLITLADGVVQGICLMCTLDKAGQRDCPYRQIFGTLPVDVKEAGGEYCKWQVPIGEATP